MPLTKLSISKKLIPPDTSQREQEKQIAQSSIGQDIVPSDSGGELILPPPQTTSYTQPLPTSQRPLILIDGSYFCFWRYTATKAWWGHSKQGTKEDCQIDHPVFRQRFIKHFQDSLQKIKKHFQSNHIIWGKDSPQEHLWRMPLQSDYKDGRSNNQQVGPFIAYSYQHLIPANATIQVPRAEADDVLATICRFEQNQTPTRKIIIISGDSDFLQLVTADGTVQICDPKKKLQPMLFPPGIQNSEIYLKQKILAGDKSDNIPSVPKCGPKTALRLAQDYIAFNEEILGQSDRKEQFYKNQQMIDFQYIPTDIGQQIMKDYLSLML